MPTQTSQDNLFSAQDEIDIAELEVQIMNQELSLKSNMLRRKQVQGELVRLETNDNAAKETINTLKAKLQEKLNKTKG